jgi:hypothetical protein
MNRRSVALLLLLALPACRTYEIYGAISEAEGLVPGDQMARYGREQAQAVAIARQFAQAYQGSSPDAFAAQADSAVTYARTLPDVADADADPLSHRLTVQFKSGWLAGIVPLSDGQGPADTPGLSP